jgi:hypothetical protein
MPKILAFLNKPNAITSSTTKNKTAASEDDFDACKIEPIDPEEIYKRLQTTDYGYLPNITLEECGAIFSKICSITDGEVAEELKNRGVHNLSNLITPTDKQREHINGLLDTNYFNTLHRENSIASLLEEKFKFLGIDPIAVRITDKPQNHAIINLPMCLITPHINEATYISDPSYILIHPLTACFLTDVEIVSLSCHEIIHDYHKHSAQAKLKNQNPSDEELAENVRLKRENEKQADREGVILSGNWASYSSGLIKITEALQLLQNIQILEESGKLDHPDFMLTFFERLGKHALDVLAPGIASPINGYEVLEQAHRVDELLESMAPEVKAVRILSEQSDDPIIHLSLNERLRLIIEEAKTPKENFPHRGF